MATMRDTGNDDNPAKLLGQVKVDGCGAHIAGGLVWMGLRKGDRLVPSPRPKIPNTHQPPASEPTNI